MNQSIWKAAGWKALEKFGSRGIQFVIQIILARILLPDDYGIVSILTVFIALSNVFIQNGFSTSLIQKKDASQTDFCTALFSSLGIAAVFYIILYAAAPLIADFYQMKALAFYLRVMALTLFPGAFQGIQYAYVSRTLNFRAYTSAMLLASTVSGIAGIAAAFSGMGVWAIILQQLLANYLCTVLLYLLVRWKIRFVFSADSFRHLFGYGWKILGSSLLNSLYASIYNLVIARVYTKEMLGLYTRGQQFPFLITENLNEMIQSITLPVLSRRQDNPADVKNVMKRGLSLSAFLIFPAMLGMSAISREFILVILGQKWIAAAPYMELLCFVYCAYPVHTMNIQCVKAVGRSDIFLKLEVYKKILETAAVILTVRKGILAMIWGQVMLSLAGMLINAWPSKKLIQYGFREQVQDLMPVIIPGVLMYLAVKLVSCLALAVFPKLVLELITGAAVYTAVSMGIKSPPFMYLLNQVKSWKKTS